MTNDHHGRGDGEADGGAAAGGDRTDHPHPVDPERVAAARAGQLSPGEAGELAALLGVLGEPVRARIVTALLAADELCVGDLALALEVSEDAVSYALRVLRAARLVRRRAAGRMAFYRLADGDVRPSLVASLEHLQRLARPRPDPGPGPDPGGRDPGDEGRPG